MRLLYGYIEILDFRFRFPSSRAPFHVPLCTLFEFFSGSFGIVTGIGQAAHPASVVPWRLLCLVLRVQDCTTSKREPKKNQACDWLNPPARVIYIIRHPGLGSFYGSVTLRRYISWVIIPCFRVGSSVRRGSNTHTHTHLLLTL